MSEKQTTLNKEVSLTGTGLHTGANVTVNLKPADPNHGFKFKRTDIDSQPIIAALSNNVSHTERGTVLENNGVVISTIEHCLSALRGMGVDNCLIEVNGPEIPILDGSARYFAKSIREAGIVEQNEERKYFVVKEKMVYEDKESGIKIVALPYDQFSIDTHISYNSSNLLANQYASIESLDEYEEEISICRTFVFLHEIEPLLKNNLIKGGDLDNAIIIVDREMPQDELNRLADLFDKPHITVESIGILNNVELNFPNEMARHKLLDLIGDLSLAGLPIKGKIIATRPGHKANVKFAEMVRKEIKKNALRPKAPSYDPNIEPVLDINAIRKLLPHRPPFLLVDKIIEIGEKHIVGVKNITMNEPFFVGHFPDEPVMPAVLQIEAMAQVGGLLVLNMVDEPEKYSTYFLKIDNVRMRKKVVPGDTLIFKLNFISDLRRGVAYMKGVVFVGDTIVSEGEFMAQVIKNKE